MGADRVPAYGTPESYIQQAVKEQKKQKPATSVSKPVVSWSASKEEKPATSESYIQQAVKEQKKQKPATSGSNPVISWSDSKVKIPDTSEYFKMVAETFNKNKASYDAMFPTRKPATPSPSSTSSPSSSGVKKAEKPEAEGQVKLVKFEYTAEQEGQIKTELKIIENKLKELEEKAPKYEGDDKKYREDADAYNAKKAIYQNAQKAFGFMTTIQKGKEESPAELKRILKDYTSHKDALKHYFDLADNKKDGILTDDYKKRFGALTSATVDIIPEKDEYKALEDACNKSAPSTPVTSTLVSSTPTNSTPDLKGSTGSKGSTVSTVSTVSPDSKGSKVSIEETPENILEKLEQKEQFNKDIKNFNSRKKALPSLMFDDKKLEEEAKFVENLLKQFGKDKTTINGDNGFTLSKDEVEAYKERIEEIKKFATEKVTNKPDDVLKKLEEAGDQDAEKLKFLDTLSDKEVLMLLKDRSQDVVRNFFPKDNIGDDTASYTYLLTRMTNISKRFGVEVPPSLSKLNEKDYSGGNSQTEMEHEDKRYKDVLPYSVKEGYGGDDKQIIWMKTIDSLTAGFKTEKEIEETKQRTNEQKVKVFEFYVDRIKNVGKNNPDAEAIINESEERLGNIAKKKDQKAGKYLHDNTTSNIDKNEIKEIIKKIKYTLTDAEIKKLLKPYRKGNNEDGVFKEGESCKRINNGLSLEEAIALVAKNHEFIEEMVNDVLPSSTDELGVVYNCVRNNLRDLGYKGALPEGYKDIGDEEDQHAQFNELKRILIEIGCIPKDS